MKPNKTSSMPYTVFLQAHCRSKHIKVFNFLIFYLKNVIFRGKRQAANFQNRLVLLGNKQLGYKANGGKKRFLLGRLACCWGRFLYYQVWMFCTTDRRRGSLALSYHPKLAHQSVLCPFPSASLPHPTDTRRFNQLFVFLLLCCT